MSKTTEPTKVPTIWGETLVTPGVIDFNSEFAYTHGQCLALAVAIARARRWGVAVVADDEGAPIHCYAVDPIQGWYYDIQGEHDPEGVVDDDEGRIIWEYTFADVDHSLCEDLVWFEDQMLTQSYALAATFVAPALNTDHQTNQEKP